MLKENALNTDETTVTEAPNTAYASVEINTWGTDIGGGKGAAHFIDTNLFGTNCGHASVAVSFPADQTGIELLKKYCFKEGKEILPYQRHAKTFRDPNTGQPKTIDVFTVNFSWWPSQEVGKPTILASRNADATQERQGVDMGPLNPQFEAALGSVIEKRLYRGNLGTVKATLAPRSVTHATTLTEQQLKILAVYTRCQEYENCTKSLAILKGKAEEKVKAKTKPNKAEGSFELLLNKFIPDWKSWVEDPNNISESELKSIVDHASHQIEAYTLEYQELNKEYATLMEEYKQDYIIAIQEEVQHIHAEIDVQSNPNPEEVKAVLSKHSPAAVLWYKMEKSIQDKAEVDLILQFFEPTGTKPPDLMTIRNALNHQIYPEGLAPDVVAALKNWRLYLPDSLANLPEAEINKKIPVMMTMAYHRKSEKILLQQAKYQDDLSKFFDRADQFATRHFESVLTSGLDSDNTLFLPVRGIKNTDKSNQHGLNVEDMLQKMNELANQGTNFDLFENNCSSTTGAILAAGAEPELKSYFEERLAGVYGTPQVVLNGAVHYHENILKHGGKIPLMERLNRYNPLNTIPDYTSKLLHTYFDPKIGTVQKTALVLPIISLGLVSGACEVIKAVGNPRKTFDQCRNFVNYALKRPSNFLKACAVPVGLLGAALAVPAAIQTGITGAVTAIMPKPVKPTQKRPIEKQVDDREHIIVIDKKDPLKALKEYHQIITNQTIYMPEFSPASQKIVMDYLNHLDKSNAFDLKIIEDYENDTKALYGRMNAQLAKPQGVAAALEPHQIPQPILESRPESITHHRNRMDEELQPLSLVANQEELLISEELNNRKKMKEFFIEAITSDEIENPITLDAEYADQGIDEAFIKEALEDLLNDPERKFDPLLVDSRVIQLGPEAKEIRLHDIINDIQKQTHKPFRL